MYLLPVSDELTKTRATSPPEPFMTLTLTAAEFQAVREALSQYVENTTDALDLEPSGSVAAECAAGAAVLERLNLAMIAAAGI